MPNDPSSATVLGEASAILAKDNRRPEQFVSAHGGVSGSSGFGWLGILLLRLNFPQFVASPSGFKALRRLFGIVTYRRQGQCPVLNLEEGSDNITDAISL